MDLHNTFEVPLPPDQAWRVLLDIARIAPCMPGAELTEVVDATTYKGKVSVKLGPVALAFAGAARFEETDASSHRAKVSAQGTDAKGRGGASANVTFRLEPAGAGCKVLVDTTLNLSGSIAQYGRGTGMIQSVATQLIGQFAKNLEAELNRGQAAGMSVAATGDPPAPTTRATVAPISGFPLVWAALLDVLRGLFGRRTGS